MFNKQRKEKMEKERERIQLMNADPFDPSVQSVIAEEIRLFSYCIKYYCYINMYMHTYRTNTYQGKLC